MMVLSALARNTRARAESALKDKVFRTNDMTSAIGPEIRPDGRPVFVYFIIA